MNCIVPGVNLKVFGRAIHSLAKIGDELYFEPLEQGLSLRTVNSSRSAYACFLFFPSYFQHYNDGRQQEEDEEEGFRCKVTMKSVMAVFRSLSSIEKTVEKCKISHNAKEARLVFELHCRHGIIKTHNLAYIECETLQAIFSKDLCPNKLTASSKLLCEVVVNFQATQEEITLTVRPDSVSLKNYVEDEADPSKVVHTELSLAPEEFDQYRVGVDTDITFCLKELRAILAFGETTGLPLNINFENSGRPVTFCIDSDQTFEANFVLATLADAEQSSSQQQPHSPQVQQAESARHSAPGKHGISKNVQTKPKSGQTKRSFAKADKNKVQEHRGRPSPSSTTDCDEKLNSVPNLNPLAVEEEYGQKVKDKETGSEQKTYLQGDQNDREVDMPFPCREEIEVNRCEELGSSSPMIPVQCLNSSQTTMERPSLQPLDQETDKEDLDDTIPGTPPTKKFRSLFFGSSQNSTQSTQAQQKTVLAADTDEDD